MESSNTFGNIATSWLRNHGHPALGYSDIFDESDDGSDDTSFYSKLSVDNLLLEAFQSSGKEYKLASSIREQMLEEQEANLSKEVEFYRPDKTTEVKEISWCLDRAFWRLAWIYGQDLGTLKVKRNGREHFAWTFKNNKASKIALSVKCKIRQRNSPLKKPI